MRRRASRLLRLGLALLLLAAAGAVLWRLFAADPGADAVPVTLEAAPTATLRSRVVGSCAFRPRRSVTVVSETGGRVAAIPVAVGATVSAGQELVVLDDRQLQMALARSEASLAAADAAARRNLVSLRATLRGAQDGWERARDTLARKELLHRTGGATHSEVEDARYAERAAARELQSAREQLNLATGSPAAAEPAGEAGADEGIVAADPEVIQARLAVAQAAHDLAQAVLTAPLAGTLTALEASLGNRLAPGAEVATVATLDDILAEVQIDEVDIGKLQVGQAVVLTTDSVRDVELQGRVSLLPPAMTDHLVAVQVDVDVSGLPAATRLRAGASCRARIEAELKRDVTAVPFAALLERPGGSVAFVAVPTGEDDGLYRLERRAVKLGASSIDEVEVSEGVETGELVVVGNLSLLRDGLLVTRELEEAAVEEGAAAGEPRDQEQDAAE